MSLNRQLKTLQREFESSANAGVVTAIRRANAALRVSGMIDRALKAGDVVPEFALPDARGNVVAFSDLLVRGPVVISFYWGNWCGFCALELAALAAIRADIGRLGATLVAISPQAPDAWQPSEREQPAPFPLLSDIGAKVARKFGIAFPVADELRPIYAALGGQPAPLPRDNWLLPIPATYVVDWTGRAALSYLDTDCTGRLEPADILTALTCLQHRRRLDPPESRIGAAPADFTTSTSTARPPVVRRSARRPRSAGHAPEPLSSTDERETP